MCFGVDDTSAAAAVYCEYQHCSLTCMAVRARHAMQRKGICKLKPTNFGIRGSGNGDPSREKHGRVLYI